MQFFRRIGKLDVSIITSAGSAPVSGLAGIVVLTSLAGPSIHRTAYADNPSRIFPEGYCDPYKEGIA
jgi:hypothetical protein